MKIFLSTAIMLILMFTLDSRTAQLRNKRRKTKRTNKFGFGNQLHLFSKIRLVRVKSHVDTCSFPLICCYTRIRAHDRPHWNSFGSNTKLIFQTLCFVSVQCVTSSLLKISSQPCRCRLAFTFWRPLAI